MTKAAKLVSVAAIVVTMPLYVPRLPDRGGAVSARSSNLAVGGGFNVLSAAARQGVEAVNASPIGTGPNSMLVRQALVSEGIRTAVAELVGDTGICMILLENDGHNTSVLSSGVEAEPQLSDLQSLQLNAGDWVYLSGTDLARPTGGGIICKWVAGLSQSINICLAPSQLIGEVAPEVLGQVISRCNLLTMNQRELRVIGSILGLDSDDMAGQLYELMGDQGALIIRTGDQGCLVRAAGSGQAVQVRAFSAQVLDTTGVGDTHTGVVLASLIEGLNLEEAALRANAAASVTISRPGSATSPTRAEVARIVG